MSGTLLPNAVQTFTGPNGTPLSGGSVYFYIPGTTTPKNTWQDSAQTILNTNPVILNANGQAIIWGAGSYRQQVFDANNNLIWDQVTEDTSGGLIGNMTDNVFTAAGGGFTPGTTTQLTIAAAPGSTANCWVYFDGAWQMPDQYTVSGTTVTFTSPIPVGTQEVDIKVGNTVAIGTPGSGTIIDSMLAIGSKVYNRVIDWIDVKDYGATGNGITDDTTAFNAAFAAATAKGGCEVYVPPGKYNISSTLTLPNGVSLRGCCGAGAFGEVNNITVSELFWIGIASGTVLATVAKWAGYIYGIALDGNYVAGICFNPVSAQGCLFQNLTARHSTNMGVYLSTDGTNPMALNTWINCMIHDHSAIAMQTSGTSTSAVTLNTFVGCRFAGSIDSLRIYQYSDTNYFYGGRIEGGSQFAIVINDTAGAGGTDSILFSGVTIDGSGPTLTYIGPNGAGDMNTVAKFDMCHMTGSTVFNGAGAASTGIIKVVDCPNFASLFSGSAGDYPPLTFVNILASPFTYTNVDPFCEDIVVNGGTVSQISFIRNGISVNLGLTSGSFRLEPQDSLAVTYSSLPFMIKIPH